MREKDDLDGEREQWLHALEDLFRGDAPLRGDVVRQVAKELQAVAAVLERVPGDERTVAPPEASSPNTFHGSNAWRNSKWIPRLVIEPMAGNRNSKCGANHSV